MNQILQVEKNKKENKPSINIKETVIFFIITLIIFGLILGAYWIYKKIISADVKLPFSEEPPPNLSTIDIIEVENHKLLINVKDEDGISSIKYYWNNEDEKITELEGSINIEKTIDIPIGENTINITVIDIEGRETNKQELIIREQPRPVIEFSIVGNDIKISITSEIELSSVTYGMNSESEKKENMLTYVDKNNFEKKLEIPIGNNVLRVTAEDINGGKSEKTQEIKGITRATTTTKVEGEYWHFNVIGKENIKTVEFEFNGKKYLMNADTFGETKNVHYKVKLVEGTNYLQIKSTTQSGGEDITTWNQEYTR